MIDGRSHCEIEWNVSIEEAVLWERGKEGTCFARSGQVVEELVVFYGGCYLSCYCHHCWEVLSEPAGCFLVWFELVGVVGVYGRPV